MLKILQAKFQQCINHELQMFKLDLEKTEEPKIKLLTSIGSWKKQENSRKTSISALLTMPKPLTVWITTNWKILKEMRITDPSASWEICMWVKKQLLESDMEHWTGSKLGKEYFKAVYCYLAYLTSMQSTSCKNARLGEAQAGIKIARRSINNLRYADDTTLMAES